MHNQVLNDNLIKLKELSDKICENEKKGFTLDSESIVAVEEIKKTIDLEVDNINTQPNKEEKLKCYEKMFQKVKIILNNFNF